ncbi:phosphoribosylglycinamide formyltransferase [Sphingomonas sp. RS6]
MGEPSGGASSPKKRLGILISGRGSNMASLVEAAAAPDCPYAVALVASDKPEAAGLAWAAERGVPTFAQSPKGMPKAEYEAKINAALREAGVEAIALAGYMRLLSDDFVARWRGRIVNIHPSLLPKYKGLDTHARAIEAGDAEAGASVHIVTEELDGGAVLGQARVPILAGDTPDALAARVLAEEHRLYPRVLAAWLNGRG